MSFAILVKCPSFKPSSSLVVLIHYVLRFYRFIFSTYLQKHELERSQYINPMVHPLTYLRIRP